MSSDLEINEEKQYNQIINLQDTTTEYILMCKESSFLKVFFENHKLRLTNKDIVVKDNGGESLIWLPNQKQLQEIIGFSDNLTNEEFLEDITLFFEDIKKTVKSYPWINGMEKALLHLLMEKEKNEFWNVKLKIWQEKY